MKALALSAAVIALSAVPQLAVAQIGGAQYCLQTGVAASCIFSTMGACEKARENNPAGQCITRTDAQGTTGMGNPRGRSSTPTQPSADRY